MSKINLKNIYELKQDKNRSVFFLSFTLFFRLKQGRIEEVFFEWDCKKQIYEMKGGGKKGLFVGLKWEKTEI